MSDEESLPVVVVDKKKERLSTFDSADELLRAVVRDLPEDPNRFARIRAQVIKMSTWRALLGSRKKKGKECERQGTPSKDLMLLTVILQEIASFAFDQYGTKNVLLPNEVRPAPEEVTEQEKRIGEQLTAAAEKRGGVNFDAFGIFRMKPLRGKGEEE